MNRMRTVIAVLALSAGAVALAGCAGDPDTGALEDQLTGVPGVNDASVAVLHPGAPWNTEVAVWLFVDDASVDGLVDAARGAAPVLAADGTASRNTVLLAFIEGEPGDYTDRREAIRSELPLASEVYAELGLPEHDNYALKLEPADLATLAAGG